MSKVFDKELGITFEDAEGDLFDKDLGIVFNEPQQQEINIADPISETQEEPEMGFLQKVLQNIVDSNNPENVKIEPTGSMMDFASSAIPSFVDTKEETPINVDKLALAGLQLVGDTYEYAYRPIRATLASALLPMGEDYELSDSPEIFSKVMSGVEYTDFQDIFEPLLSGKDKPSTTVAGLMGSVHPFASLIIQHPPIADTIDEVLPEFLKPSSITGLGVDIGTGILTGTAAIKGVKYAAGAVRGIFPSIAKQVGVVEKPLNTIISILYGGNPKEVTKEVTDITTILLEQEAAQIRNSQRKLQKMTEDILNTSNSDRINVLSSWDKDYAPPGYTMNKIDRETGSNITESFAKVKEAVHRIDYELPEIVKYFTNRTSKIRQAGVDMETATDLLSQIGYNGSIKGNRSEILKRLNGNEEALTALLDVRAQFDNMYMDIASVRLNNISSKIESLANVEGVPEKLKELIAKNMKDLSERLAKDPTLIMKVSGNNNILFEEITKGFSKIQKEDKILKKYIKNSLSDVEEFRYVDNYVRGVVREDHMADLITGSSKKPKTEKLIQSKMDDPSMMKQKRNLIPESEAERNLEVLINKYSRSYLDYKYMKEAVKGLPEQIKKLENVPIMGKEEMSSFIGNLEASLGEAVGKKQTSILYNDIYNNMVKRKGSDLTNVERRTLKDFFNKHEEQLFQLDKVRSAGSIDVESYNRISGDVRDIVKGFSEIPKEVAEEMLPALQLKISSLRGRVTKDFANPNLIRRLENLERDIKKVIEVRSAAKTPIDVPEGLTRYTPEELVGDTSETLTQRADDFVMKPTTQQQTPIELQLLEDSAGTTKPTMVKDVENIYENIDLARLEKLSAPKIENILGDKLQKKIDDTLKWADSIYSKVDEKSIREGELFRVMNGGNVEGEIADLLSTYKQGTGATIGTDAADYVKKWFDDALGYGSREEGAMNKTIKSNFTKLFNSNRMMRALSEVMDGMGLGLNPKARLSDVADLLRTEVYTNLIGFRIGNTIRNLTQPFLHTLPAINVNPIDKAKIVKKMAGHFGNEASWKEFREQALKSDFIVSDMDRVNKAIFDRNLEGVGKFVGDLWDAKNKTFMFLYNTSDLINRFNSYWMAKEAASISIKKGKGSVNKLLNTAYVLHGDRRRLLNVLNDQGTDKFISEYSRYITDKTQFVYKNIERSPFLRNKFARLAIMFSKWPVEIAARESHYVGELFRGNPEGAVGLARDFMYGLVAFQIGKNLLGLDLTSFHPQSSLTMPAQSPWMRTAFEFNEKGVAESIKDLAVNYSPAGGVKTAVKTVNELIGESKTKNRLGLTKYKEGSISQYHRMTPLGVYRAATEDDVQDYKTIRIPANPKKKKSILD